MKRPEYLVVITGLSGSGKSYVQSTLEDLGFYCVDNLPIELIVPFLDEVGTHENATRVGIVVDVRTHDFARVFPTFYRERIRTVWLPQYARPGYGCLAAFEKASGAFVGWFFMRPAPEYKFAAEAGWTRPSELDCGTSYRPIGCCSTAS